MNIVVCIKQVPDMAEVYKVKTDPTTGTIIREGIPAVVNPLDEYAVEEAVRIKENFGGKVTVITMGPPQASDALVKCLSMGADEAILLSDRAFAGADTLVTAYTLASAIRKIGEFDIILCGQQASDGSTGQVGPSIAENLHIPQVTYVNKVEINEQKVKAQREVEGGIAVVESELPVMLTVLKGINEPRIPTFGSIAEAMGKEIPTWTAKDLDAESARLGLDGSPTRVVKTWPPEPRSRGRRLEGEPADIARELVNMLKADKVI